jgi:hypothetical protein
MTTKKDLKLYAGHVGLTIREHDGVFTLVQRASNTIRERDGVFTLGERTKKRTIRTYRSIGTLGRGIDRYVDRMLHDKPKEQRK